MRSKQSCTKQPTELMKAYHVEMHQEDGSDQKLLCIYTDPLSDPLIKEIKNIIKKKVTRLSECVCRHEWAHLIIFSEEMSDTEVRIINGLLKKMVTGLQTYVADHMRAQNGIPLERTLNSFFI